MNHLMNKMSTLSWSGLPLKFLLGAILGLCVAAAPFDAANRSTEESARTLAFAGRLLEVGKERWAAEGMSELAVAPLAEVEQVAGIPSITALVPQEQGSQEPDPVTMGGATTCPVSHTSCPVQLTLCPIVNTHCPAQATVCVTTQCPVAQTVCPEQATTCQVTTCPVVRTSCPTLATNCPAVSTVCPVSSTFCPVVTTTCPLTFTTCNSLPTRCPKDPTVCENTVCPAETTVCPIVTTRCHLTVCSVDRESSCHSHPICNLCSQTYQAGQPAGFLAPEQEHESLLVLTTASAELAPRLTFLP